MKEFKKIGLYSFFILSFFFHEMLEYVIEREWFLQEKSFFFHEMLNCFTKTIVICFFLCSKPGLNLDLYISSNPPNLCFQTL